jgi:hypothetical protein
MKYTRLHIRVPAAGGAMLVRGNHLTVKAEIINISAGGIRITSPSFRLDDGAYRVELLIRSTGRIVFSGFPVYQSTHSVGIRILSIEPDHLKKIYQLVEGFQISEDFIRHIDQGDIINDWFTDESGEEISITFETS